MAHFTAVYHYWTRCWLGHTRRDKITESVWSSFLWLILTLVWSQNVAVVVNCSNVQVLVADLSVPCDWQVTSLTAVQNECVFSEQPAGRCNKECWQTAVVRMAEACSHWTRTHTTADAAETIWRSEGEMQSVDTARPNILRYSCCPKHLLHSSLNAKMSFTKMVW